MRLSTGIVMLGAAGLALAGCTSGSEAPAGVVSSPAADATGALSVWLMDSSQPQAVIDAVNTRFAEEYPKVTVDVETQQWAGIQDKLIASLGTDTAPDVVEIGNTLTAKYADAGLLADLSAYAGEFEVDGMLPGLQPSGELEGVRYGIPYYGGVRLVVYSKSQFKDAGVEVPNSLDELSAAAEKLQAANADNPKYSAFYFPGRYWDGAVPFVWDAGAEIAQQEGDTWTGTLDSAEAITGLTTLKGLVQAYSKAPVDADESKNFDAFKTGDVGMMVDSWWVPGALNTGTMKGDIGAFALPGSAQGSTSPVFFGGSDLAVPAKSAQQDLAVQWMRILTGLQVQTELAKSGVIPNQEGAFVGHQGNEFLAVADEAATNSRFTPVSPYWVNVVVSQLLADMLEQIFSDGATVEEATRAASEQITEILNG
jgi:N,N'-diacetylchitobiose transport system substrate-binding protein